MRAEHVGFRRAIFTLIPCLATLALLLAAAQPVAAQIAPRLTGEVAIKELDAASAALAAHAASQPGTALDDASQQLKALAASLHESLGGDIGKPVETIDGATRARVLRAHAAALRTQDFLKSCNGCTGADTAATAAALAAGIDALAKAGQMAKLVPVIDTVETLDHRPLFAVRQGGKSSGLALNGVNLADTQCADPRITATDAGGKPLATQPTLTGVLATRLELHWPEVAALSAGPVVLHVVPQHKVFLLGCTTLPEATATFRVTPPVRYAVAYELSATCASGQTVLSHGTMPTIEGYGSTVARTIDTSSCAAPQSYTVTATVALGGGSPVSVGPITQSADAAITAGLPGGLILSWNPTVKTLFVRSGASQCKGVD
jgi:hypothetical protein